MATRIVTGLILATGAILLLTLAPPWAAYILVQIASLLVAHEFYTITLGTASLEANRARYVGILVVGGLCALAWFAPRDLISGLVVAPLILLPTVLFSAAKVEDMGPRAALLVCGVYYLGLAICTLTLITAMGSKGPLITLALFAAVFAGDSGAFFSGKFLGKNSPKLYAKISPKKTWAGSIGGAIASVLGFMLINWLGDLRFDLHHAAIMGFGCGVVEQVGDLAESLFKRAYGVKDSGNILPGHGGIWDRIDGVLFAAPFLGLYLRHFA